MRSSLDTADPGMYHDFDWRAAPMSSPVWPLLVGTLYFLTMVFGQDLIRRTGVKMTGLHGALQFHNGFLSVLSLVMFVGCLFEMFQRWRMEGTTWIFCEAPSVRAQGPLYFWSYVFYLSKYYEMVDTVLALLKGSELPHFWLHVYHHSIVPILIWAWLEHCQTLQFPGLLFNTFVHVIMYAYYFLRLRKVPTPWKVWVTRLQIVQFVSSLFFFARTLTYIWQSPLGGICAGQLTMFANIFVNLTLLPQFVNVLRKLH